MTKLKKMVTSPKRFAKIVSILTKYGLQELISGTSLENQLDKAAKTSKEAQSMTRYERVRMVLQELGTTFIKFGQIMSQRTDLLPEELTDQLALLQDNIDPVEIDIEAFFAERFDKGTEHFFTSFKKEPLAVASIGQVYEGVLKSGRHVVLKIRKPEADKTVKQDLALMGDMLKSIANKPAIRDYKPMDLFSSFKETLLNELDYDREINNIKRFQKNHEADHKVYVPEVFPELCSEDTICMEFISGAKVSDQEKVSAIYEDGEALSKIICDYYFDQILEHGFYHADPHPGNVIVLDNGKVCLIDYGMTGALLEHDRYVVGDFFLQLINMNSKALVDILKEINLSPKSINENTLEYEIDEVLQGFNVSLESMNSAEMINQIIAIANSHQIALPRYFFNLLRTVVLIEGLIRDISPSINIMELIKPYAMQMFIQRANPKNIVKNIISSAVGFERNLAKIPALINRLIAKAAEDELKVNIEARELMDSLPRLERISNNLILAVLVGSLLISSSLIVLAKIPPFVWDIPLLGFLGYVFSAIIALYIIVKMMRR